MWILLITYLSLFRFYFATQFEKIPSFLWNARNGVRIPCTYSFELLNNSWVFFESILAGCWSPDYMSYTKQHKHYLENAFQTTF